ncbi:hypothetical protein [Arsenicibacter rosenii]|uniref:Uncharacterized protein n=1 Tax=Arsenicibacter rosenii TaxID=1750698 RepID=A0A1S2VQ64_9BACT|nr:hypothetical protein [Arsenicibacter rosenii]OIN60911.1 hypothetical protein BLX24_02155 [Arsenicibacter rosenii]
MNQFFSLSRFRLLLIKNVREQKSALIGAALVTTLIQAGFGLTIVYSGMPGNMDSVRANLFAVMGLLLWGVFTWQITSELNERDKGMMTWLMPASVFEKVLSLWVITGIGFALWYTLSFMLIDSLGTYYVNHKTWSPEDMRLMKEFGETLPVRTFALGDIHKAALVGFLAIINPLAMFATLFFRRYSLVFGVLLVVGVMVEVVWLNGQIFHWLTGYHVNSPFESVIKVYKRDVSGSRDLVVPAGLSNTIRGIIGVLSVGLLYAAAYFRFKEREV